MADSTAEAALSFEIGSNTSKIQLLPAHDFKAKDGRPKEVARWKINGTIAAKIISKINAQKDKILIDYEHSTLHTEKTGLKAPASGWFKKLQWIEGIGLFAVDVEWTPAAREFIKKREYRYISPVLSYDKQTGDVTGILMAALVNYPAIDGLQDVGELIAAKAEPNQVNQLSDDEMKVCALMGIPHADYLTEKSADLADHSITSLKVNQAITENEVLICEKLGVNIDDYLSTKSTL